MFDRDKLMAQGNGRIEVEIKLKVASAAEARRLLRSRGFRILHRRVFEVNLVFDTPSRDLLTRRRLLRLRQAGTRRILTFKAAPGAGPHKSRAEWEVTIGDLETCQAILRELGYEPVFRYEKYRTEYIAPGSQGLAMLDETPIGVWLELEGAPDWIDRTAAAMGFSPCDYVTSSYGSLFREHCEQTGLKTSHMVFHTDADV